MEIAEIWVDAAMRVGPRDIRLMERLVKCPGPSPLRRSAPVARKGHVPPRTGNA